MKNVLWIIVAAGVLVGGYLLFSGKSITELIGGTPEATEAEAAMEDAGSEEAATDAPAAEEPTVQEMIEETAEDAASEPAAESSTQDGAAMEPATNGETLDELLTVENFDLAKVTERIKDSSLNALEQTALVEALRNASNDPDMLRTTLEQGREALGL